MPNSRKKALDYTPLIVLLISAIILCWRVNSAHTHFDGRHYLALIFIASTLVLFLIRHMYGVVASGIVLFLGLFGIYSFDPDVNTMTSFTGEHGHGYTIRLFVFQPAFIILIILDFIILWKSYSKSNAVVKQSSKF